MGYRAIALSQVDGAGGEPIGHGLAEQLGFGYLNEAVIANVAADQGVDTSVVADAERRKSFLERLAPATAFAGIEGISSDMAMYAMYAMDHTDTILGFIRGTVREAADRGKVVLVGHAACYACADHPDVLRVCTTASLPTRASRVASDRGISEKDAVKLLRQSDAGRASYLKRVYGVDSESPADYDIVVNTDRLDRDAAIAAILALAGTGDSQD